MGEVPAAAHIKTLHRVICMSPSRVSTALGICVLAVLMPVHWGRGEELIGRLKYGGGGDWYVNPTSLPNLLKFAREHTNPDLPEREEAIEPDSREILDFAFIHATGHGQIRFNEAERENLRDYLLGGGFLHVDDNYGLDEHFRPEVKKLFPNKELVELPFSHPIYHCFFDFDQGLPKIHEHHGGPPHGYAIVHEGRVALFYSFNTDLGDGWESEEVHHDPPDKRLAALRMGTNLLVYALSR